MSPSQHGKHLLRLLACSVVFSTACAEDLEINRIGAATVSSLNPCSKSFLPEEEKQLDNPIWTSLSGEHTAFSINGKTTKKYPSDMTGFGSFSPEYTPDWNDLASLLSAGESSLIVSSTAPDTKDLRVVRNTSVGQYIYTKDSVTARDRSDIIELSESDLPDIAALTKITKMPQIGSRLLSLGRHFGIRIDGQLVSMAGLRMRMGRFVEISSVCTAPNYEGLGLATSLIIKQIGAILGEGKIPMLHSNNPQAILLYEKLGFELRKDLSLVIVERVK